GADSLKRDADATVHDLLRLLASGVSLLALSLAGGAQIFQGVGDVRQKRLTSCGRFGRVGAVAHDAAVEDGGLFADAGDQGGQVSLALALVHHLGVVVGVTQPPGQSIINILSHLGAASHLAEVVGVEADEVFYDQFGASFPWKKSVKVQGAAIRSAFPPSDWGPYFALILTYGDGEDVSPPLRAGPDFSGV